MATTELSRLTHRQIATCQDEEFRQMAERVFAPNETTRSDTYLLPHLDEGRGLLKKRTDYEIALAEFLKKEPEIRLLDVGCGAGFWLEKQATRNHRLSVFGISAKDYRSPENRPPIVYLGRDGIGGGPIFQTPNGHLKYYGIELGRTGTIDDEHYVIDDVHEALQVLPANSFHLVVSFQACRYLFDPLRVLKQIHRLLVPNGYAFLESFNPQVFDKNENRVSHRNLQKMFLKGGSPVRYGEYQPTELHVRHGLAIKKTYKRLLLPITYRRVVSNPMDNTHVATYYLIS